MLISTSESSSLRYLGIASGCTKSIGIIALLEAREAVEEGKNLTFETVGPGSKIDLKRKKNRKFMF